jgi:predicted metal-dependent phosphoesterase TrpH
MPAHQPFTLLCRQLARGRPAAGRADLHIHTTFSDGEYRPAEVVDLARRAGLAAIAITDHDSTEGLAEAREAAAGSGLEIVSGVEITAEFQERELHLLGYFVRETEPALQAALARLREHRDGRFWEMVERIRHAGVRLDAERVAAFRDRGCLGRRHLAMLLVETGQAGSVREAFARYLKEGGRADVPKLRLPVAEAIALVRGAGGVAAWAHPPYDSLQQHAAALRELGLSAIEAAYPKRRPATVRSYRALAARWGFAVTGGSDYHGSEHAQRTLGCCTVSDAELAELRSLAHV